MTKFIITYGYYPQTATGSVRATVGLLKACARDGVYANAKQIGEARGKGRTYRRTDGTWCWKLVTVELVPVMRSAVKRK